MDTAVLQPAATYITSAVSYVKPMQDKPYNYMHEPPQGQPWQNCEYDLRTVQIRNARQSVVAPALDSCGFQLTDAPTDVKDFSVKQDITGRYYEEMKAVALRVTGGSHAVVFDHLVRKREPGRPALTFGRKTPGVPAAAVGRVHNDYTERSGRRRLGLVLGAEAAEQVTGRYCIVNIWRSIKGPVVDTPLALCDSRSVRDGDLVDSDIHYHNRTGEIHLVHFNPAHRWCYFHELQPDEAIVFKQYDSSAQGVSRFTPHAAFDYPDTPPDAPLRESIETRILVVF